MCHVRMRKIILIIILFCGVSIVNAQLNYIQKGNKLIYFGISVGFNLGDYAVVRKPKLNTLQTDSVKLIKAKFGPGFDLGIIGNLQLHKFFDIRFVPSLTFSDKKMIFTNQDDQPKEMTVSSIYLNMPLYFRYKSKPIKDFRFFVLGGFRYNYDLNAKANERNNENLLLVNKHDFGVEMGFGFQIFFPSFVMSPEIKVYRGLMNVKETNNELIYSRAIDKLFSRIFTITINLEG